VIPRETSRIAAFARCRLHLFIPPSVVFVAVTCPSVRTKSVCPYVHRSVALALQLRCMTCVVVVGVFFLYAKCRMCLNVLRFHIELWDRH